MHDGTIILQVQTTDDEDGNGYNRAFSKSGSLIIVFHVSMLLSKRVDTKSHEQDDDTPIRGRTY